MVAWMQLRLLSPQRNARTPDGVKSTQTGDTRPTRHVLGCLASFGLALVVTIAAGGSTAVATEPRADVASPQRPVSFDSTGPRRIADTRASQGSYPRPTLRSGQTLRIDAGTNAPIAINVTAVSFTNTGHLSLYPCAAGSTSTSQLNFDASASGGPVANVAVVTPDTNRAVCVDAVVADGGTVDVIVDLSGTFELGLVSTTVPKRMHDTRDDVRPLQAGQVLRVTGLEPNTPSIVNLTTVRAQEAGFLVAYPCQKGKPNTSSSNFVAGGHKATMGVYRTDGDGNLCVYSSATTQLIVDLFGTATTDTKLVEMSTPTRVMDTRVRGHRGPYYAGSEFRLKLPKWRGRAAILNVTAVRPTGAGHITVYPCSSRLPTASTLNYVAGQIVPNGVIVKPDKTGEVCINSFARTDLVVDFLGFVGSKQNTVAASNDDSGCSNPGIGGFNRERSAAGVKQVHESTALFAATCEWAKKMARDGFVSHDPNSGVCSEVVGFGATVSALLLAWHNSPLHQQAVTNPGLRTAAFAVTPGKATVGGTTYDLLFGVGRFNC